MKKKETTLTLPSKNPDQWIGRLEGTMAHMRSDMKRLNHEIQRLHERLYRLEHHAYRWQGGMAVMLSLTAILGSILPYFLKP